MHQVVLAAFNFKGNITSSSDGTHRINTLSVYVVTRLMYKDLFSWKILIDLHISMLLSQNFADPSSNLNKSIGLYMVKNILGVGVPPLPFAFASLSSLNSREWWAHSLFCFVGKK